MLLVIVYVENIGMLNMVDFWIGDKVFSLKVDGKFGFSEVVFFFDRNDKWSGVYYFILISDLWIIIFIDNYFIYIFIMNLFLIEFYVVNYV